MTRKQAVQVFFKLTDKRRGAIIARELGVDPSLIARIRRGQRNPSGELAVKIRKLCEIPTEAWFT